MKLALVRDTLRSSRTWNCGLLALAGIALLAVAVVALTASGPARAAAPLPPPFERQPYSQSLYCFDDTYAACHVALTIPAGKRFTIEYISANVLVDHGATATGLQIISSDSAPMNGPTQARHFHIPVVFQYVGSDGDYYTVSEKVLIHAEPAANHPSFYVSARSGAKIILVGSVTGYLENLN